MNFRGLSAISLLAFASWIGVGCHVEGSIKASTSEEPRADSSESATTPAATTQTTTAAAPPPVTAPSTPPADACPLHCYEARGSEAVDLTNEEVNQLRSALEPVVGRMRQCVPPEEWRRHGSATVNLRIAPDGTLAELGVDPGHGGQTQCFDDAGRGASASVTLPGHKVVRCTERCVRETRRRGRRAR